MRPVATRKRRGASIDFDLDKQPNRRETAKRRSGAGFKRKSACPSRAPGHVLGMFLFQGAWPCLLRKHPGGAPSFPPALAANPGPPPTKQGTEGKNKEQKACHPKKSSWSLIRAAQPCGSGSE